uniref:Uncharacterized protein n=1 Tax=Macrostomum lignano TaxID=282301 RepID=A0A1I8F2B5_9PLAT
MDVGSAAFRPRLPAGPGRPASNSTRAPCKS